MKKKGRKKKKRLPVIWIHLSKSKSGLKKDRYYIRVASPRHLGMLNFYQFLYEVRQCEWHIFQNKDKFKFRLSRRIGE